MNMNVNMNTVLRLKIQKLPEVLEDKIYRMNHQMIFSEVVGEFVERVEYLESRFSNEKIGGKYLDKFNKKHESNIYKNWYHHLLQEQGVNNIYMGDCENCKGKLLFCHCKECPTCYNMCGNLIYNSRLGEVCQGCIDEDENMLDELDSNTNVQSNFGLGNLIYHFIS